MKMNRKSQSGYSIIELSIVLAIISLLIVTGVAGVSRVLQNNQANVLLRDITSISGNISIALGRETTTEKVEADLMANLNVFPDGVASCDAFGANCDLTNAFGGEYVVNNLSVDFMGVNENRAYWLAFSGVPASMCASVARGLESLASVILVDESDAIDLKASYISTQTGLTSASAVKFLGQDITIENLGQRCRNSKDKSFGVLVRR